MVVLSLVAYSLTITNHNLPNRRHTINDSVVATYARGDWLSEDSSPPPTGVNTTDGHFDTTPPSGSFDPPSWLHVAAVDSQHSIEFTASASNAAAGGGTYKQTRKVTAVEVDFDLKSSSNPGVTGLLIKGVIESKLTATASSNITTGSVQSASLFKKKLAASATGIQNGSKPPLYVTQKFSRHLSFGDVDFQYDGGAYVFTYSLALDLMKTFASAAGTGRQAFASASVKASPKVLSYKLESSSPTSLDYILGTVIGFPAVKGIWVDCYTNTGVIVIDDCECGVNAGGGWCVPVEDGPSNVPFYTLKIHPENCLKKSYAVTTPSSGRPTLNIYYSDFYFGDLDGNNVIDQYDIDLIQEAVGIGQSDPRWANDEVSLSNPHCASYYDFNHDGAVNSTDVALVSVNLGRTGD